MNKYMEISELNSDQVKVIRENGWCIFTECDCEGTYYRKGFAWANRIGYIILSESVDVDDINSCETLNHIATYDDEFDAAVRKVIMPIADICYLFLVKDPARYYVEPVWTNKGLAYAKEIAKLKFRHKHQYYESKDYYKMEQLMNQHNMKVQKDTDTAIALLNANGFKVVSGNFAALLGKGDVCEK